MGKLILASNRLPVTVRQADDGPQIVASTGGLATGLSGLTTTTACRWVGWSGLAQGQLTPYLESRLVLDGMRPIELDDALVGCEIIRHSLDRCLANALSTGARDQELQVRIERHILRRRRSRGAGGGESGENCQKCQAHEALSHSR